MIIVGDNLLELIKQHSITEKIDSFDNTCLNVKLGEKIIRYIPHKSTTVLTYSQEIPLECYEEITIDRSGLVIPKMSAVLACSAERVKMPMGYFGLLQTKGSLARLLVSLHFSDGQVDPGYEGVITFELFNASCYDIKIPRTEPVGNLYIFKTSTNNNEGYNGRYNNAEGPTLSLLKI